MNAPASDKLVNADRRPHMFTVDAIVAALTDPLRSKLADLTRAAGFAVGARVSSAESLRDVLEGADDAWVLTGGTSAAARPFLRAAGAADVAAVALLARDDRRRIRAEAQRGGTALLRASIGSEELRIAVAASRAGFSVWDPEDARGEDRIEVGAVGGDGAAGDVVHGGGAPLSRREREVLQLTGAGRSTKAIARQLGISTNTVKFHLQSAFAKLGCNSRAEAVMVALRRGELSV